MVAEIRTRLFADPAEVQRRLEHLDDPHVARLNGYVRKLQKRRGSDNSVPWFDPSLAGVNAQILALHEAPGARSVGKAALRRRAGSGIISPDNNDQTATNFSHLTAAAGWSRDVYVSWNVVPWYLGDDKRIRGATRTDIEEALPELRAVLRLLPKLRVVVTMGRAAQIGWGMCLQHEKSVLVNVPCIHPGSQALNRYPGNRERALASLRIARAVVELA